MPSTVRTVPVVLDPSPLSANVTETVGIVVFAKLLVMVPGPFTVAVVVEDDGTSMLIDDVLDHD